MPTRKLAKIEAMLFAAYLKVKEVRREVEKEALAMSEKKDRKRSNTLILIKGGKSD